MRAKKNPKPSSRPVRYLLSADRRLQKISLRKLSDRFKGTSARSSAPAAKTAAAAKPPERPIPPPPKAYSWRMIVVGMTCVLAAAALMTARQPTEEGDAAGPQRASTSTVSVAAPKPAAAVASKPAANVASKSAASAASKPAASVASKPAPNVAPKPAPRPATIDALGATVRPGSDAESASTVKTAAATDKPAAAAVTITGCLERNDDSFWLKDTSGDVAKSRSWKTGFLKKRSPRIEVVGGPGAGTLSALVGERVAAQGTLVERELRARTVWRIGPACD